MFFFRFMGTIIPSQVVRIFITKIMMRSNITLESYVKSLNVEHKLDILSSTLKRIDPCSDLSNYLVADAFKKFSNVVAKENHNIFQVGVDTADGKLLRKDGDLVYLDNQICQDIRYLKLQDEEEQRKREESAKSYPFKHDCDLLIDVEISPDTKPEDLPCCVPREQCVEVAMFLLSTQMMIPAAHFKRVEQIFTNFEKELHKTSTLKVGDSVSFDDPDGLGIQHGKIIKRLPTVFRIESKDRVYLVKCFNLVEK